MEILSTMLSSWPFWVGMVIIVKMVSSRYVEVQRLRAQERHWRREQDAEAEKRLLGIHESQEVEGLKLRIAALEAEMAQVRGRPQVVPPKPASRSRQSADVQVIDQG